MRRAGIAIAGAGRAGAALAVALAAGGADVTLWDRDPRRARRAARAAAANAAVHLRAALEGAGTLLVAVSDEALGPFAAELAAVWPAPGPGVALHLAGSRASAVLAPLRAAGAAAGVFHPVVALTGPRAAVRLRAAFVTLSGDAAAIRAGRRLARRLGLRPVVVEDEARPLLHAAAVLAAGDLVALLGEAERVLARTGLAPRQARALLGRLAAGAVAEFARTGPAAALTGPVARGDAATVAAHLAALRSEPALRAAADLHAALVAAGARRLAEAGRLGPAALRRCLAVARSAARPYSPAIASERKGPPR